MKRKVPWVVAVVAWVVVAAGSFCGIGPGVTEPDGAEAVALPAPATEGAVSVEETIAKRRSVRVYTAEPLSIEQIGQLAWAAQGITEPQRGLRAAPSAGATYPLELYVVSAGGSYRYVPAGHRLELVAAGDLRERLSQAALGQASVRMAPVSFMMAAVVERTSQRYGPSAFKYVCMEVGHAAQNIHLQAVALGLASCPVGAFDEAQVTALLGLPADQQPLYIVPVGYPR